jgi:glucose-6-phosphate 1-dehydrogenase
VRVVFKDAPAVDFGYGVDETRTPARDQVVVKLDPTTGARIVLDARRADGEGPQAVTLDMEFADEGGEAPTPYEVLLHAALIGDPTRFKPQAVVEENWRIMQPLLDAPPVVQPYAPGSWGPAAADALLSEDGGWHGPWID